MKEILNRKGTSGISLVALIVTIIVLIILTAAVIITFMDGGIVDKAKKATFRSDIRNYQDILLEKSSVRKIDRETGTGTEELINAETLAEMKAIIPEFKDEYENLVKIEDGKLVLGTREDQPYRDWLIELGIEAGSSNGGAVALSENAIANKVAVGDYVNYSALLTGGTSSVEISGEDSGYRSGGKEKNPIDQTVTRDTTISWRVLSIDEDTGVVTLICEEPIDSIILAGDEEYLNGPRLLDDTYSTLYSVAGKGTARNLKVEDINEIMGYTEPSTIDILMEEDYDGVTMHSVYETIDYGTTIGEFENAYNITLVNGSGDALSENMRGGRITFYAYRGSDYKATTSDEYKMIFGSNGNYYKYYLSSSCINVDIGSAMFSLRCVSYGSVTLYGYDEWCAARPIVILNSSVEIGGGDGSVGSPWTIKQ